MLKKIAHITDTHLGDKTAVERGIDPHQNFIFILEALAKEGVDEIVFTGDIGEIENYAWFFEKMEAYKPGYKIITGNHDDLPEVLKYFKHNKTAGEGELYYYSEDEFYKYIFMDSSSATISPQQLEWLSSEIKTTKRIIVFIHHPILDIGTGMDTIYPLHNRNEVAQLLMECKQPVNVFCGHYHMPDKRSSGKITQHITPAASFQVKKFSSGLEIKTQNFGYRIIILTDHSVKSELIIIDYKGL